MITFLLIRDKEVIAIVIRMPHFTRASEMSEPLSKKVALLAVFTALGVVLAPFFWFPFLTTKAYPTQHFVNALAGIILGPWWAALAAVFIGAVRNMLGIGTLYAFPGGVPGAIVVGLVYRLTRRLGGRLGRYSAALLEPVGTVLIGGTFSLFIYAPAIGDVRLLGALEEKGALQLLPVFWAGWAASSVPGALLGYLVIIALDKMGLTNIIESGRSAQRSAQT